MYLNTVDDTVTDGAKVALESSDPPLTDGYMTGRSKKDVDESWVEGCVETKYWGQGSQ